MMQDNNALSFRACNVLAYFNKKTKRTCEAEQQAGSACEQDPAQPDHRAREKHQTRQNSRSKAPAYIAATNRALLVMHRDSNCAVQAERGCHLNHRQTLGQFGAACCPSHLLVLRREGEGVVQEELGGGHHNRRVAVVQPKVQHLW